MEGEYVSLRSPPGQSHAQLESPLRHSQLRGPYIYARIYGY